MSGRLNNLLCSVALCGMVGVGCVAAANTPNSETIHETLATLKLNNNVRRIVNGTRTYTNTLVVSDELVPGGYTGQKAPTIHVTDYNHFNSLASIQDLDYMRFYRVFDDDYRLSVNGANTTFTSTYHADNFSMSSVKNYALSGMSETDKAHCFCVYGVGSLTFDSVKYLVLTFLTNNQIVVYNDLSYSFDAMLLDNVSTTYSQTVGGYIMNYSQYNYPVESMVTAGGIYNILSKSVMFNVNNYSNFYAETTENRSNYFTVCPYYYAIPMDYDEVLTFDLIFYGNYNSSLANNNYQSGYERGYLDGKAEGLREGYTNGYNTALQTIGSNATFNGLFNSIADTPLRFLYGLFNFDLFGTSMLVIILSLLTGIIVFGIVRKFIR